MSNRGNFRISQGGLVRHGQVRCAICYETLDLNSAKTNEEGKAVHEECYVPRMVLNRRAYELLYEEGALMKKRKKLQGTVQRIIPPIHPAMPEKAKIDIDGGDDLYREIRVENEVTGDNGEKAKLKPGAEVDIILEADSNAIVKKPA
jgi:hypothetical protein